MLVCGGAKCKREESGRVAEWQRGRGEASLHIREQGMSDSDERLITEN
jgi:hypothetical protein